MRQRSTTRRWLGATFAALGVSAAIAAGPAFAGSPRASFPATPSPRDGAIFLLVPDTSCDQARESPQQITSVVAGLVTLSAWHEGIFGLATLRSNALLNLNFHYLRFHSQMQSDEAVRRDLQQQRADADLGRFVRYVAEGRHGACRTDIGSALMQIQRELSSIGAGGHPVTVVLITNGVLVSRGVNFLHDSRTPAVVVRELAAQGELARLPSVRLVFVGIGRRTGVTPGRQVWLEHVWSRYAQEAGSTPIFIRDTSALVVRVGGAS